MRVLVTGAHGFVGTRLVQRLADAGHATIAVDAAEMDVTDAGAVQRTLAESAPAAIVHLAGISFVPEAAADPANACRINFGGARNLLAAGRRREPRRRHGRRVDHEFVQRC